MENITTHLKNCWVSTTKLSHIDNSGNVYETAVFNNEDMIDFDCIRAKNEEEAMMNHREMVIKYAKFKKDLKMIQLVKHIENTQEVLNNYRNIQQNVRFNHNAIVINIKTIDYSTRKLAEAINSISSIKLERYEKAFYRGWYIIHFDLAEDEESKGKMLKIADRRLSIAGYETELINIEELG